MFRDGRRHAQPAEYVVQHTSAGADALLAGEAIAWAPAMDVQWGPDRYHTQFRAVWNSEALFARFDVSDHAPWHTFSHRDACLWEEEVVEIFLDPTCSGTDYAELEINPANVVCDLHIAQLTPVRDVRLEWNFATLRSAVHPGQQNDDWMAIACMPFADFASMSPPVAECLPVTVGDVWHFNVFRIKRPHGPADRERGSIYAAWSVPDGPTFHAPEAFRPLRFAGA